MKKIILLIVFFPLLARAEEARWRLMFAGDIMGHDPQIESAMTAKGSYDYAPTFRFVKPVLEKADFALANLELTLAGAPYKGYPRFSSPDALADAVKDAGFDMLLTANNHSCDRGEAGLERTIKILDEKGIPHTGTFVSPEDREKTYPLMIEARGLKLVFLNATYGTNMLKVSTPTLVNYIKEEELLKDLEKAKALGGDLILVGLHWGEEYKRESNKDQQKLAKKLLEHGADVIVGAHPHVLQEVREYKVKRGKTPRKAVAYFSHGNFVSNQRDRYRDGGMIGQMEVVRDGDGVRIDGFGYTPTWVWKRISGGKTVFHILPVSLYESSPENFALTESDKTLIAQFASDARKRMKGVKEYKYLLRLDAEEPPPAPPR